MQRKSWKNMMHKNRYKSGKLEALDNLEYKIDVTSNDLENQVKNAQTREDILKSI